MSIFSLQKPPPRVWGIALLLMVAASYWPALFGAFVWDDKAFLGAPPVTTWAGLADIWFRPGSIEFEGHYWPLVYTTFWLEHKLWGFENPLPFHAVNIALHGGVTVLLWQLLQRLAVPGAWFIAALFAVHPVHVEAVAWVIARKDLLATLFYLLAVGCWLDYRQCSESAQSPRRRRGRRGGDGGQRRAPSSIYLSMCGLFIAGMLSKSLVITMPVVLLLLLWWHKGQVLRRDVMQTLPLFIIGFAIVAFDLHHYSDRADLELGYTTVERALMAAQALWFYASKLLWPEPLLAIYPLWDVSPKLLINWLYLLAALVLAVGLYLARARIGRGPLVGALCFAIILSPMLGFGDNSFMEFAFVADRYQYLASAGLMAVLVAALATAYQHLQFAAARGLLLFLAASSLLAYGALSFRQSSVYRDEVALFNQVIAYNPEAYHVYFNLGNALMEAERFDEAVDTLSLAVQRNPETINIRINLGVVYLELQRYLEAEEAFRQAIAIEADNFQAHQNLAAALRRQDRFAESLAAMQTAAALQPPPAQHYYYMARDARDLGQPEEAARYYQLALQTDPSHSEARSELMSYYLDAGRYQDALDLDPMLPQALDQLAYDSFHAGQVEEALQLYRHGVALSPDSPHSHANLGAALAQSGRYQEALQSLQQALAIDPAHPDALTSIAAVRQMLNTPPAP